MSSYVALLRGINVGGNNKVPMAKLKKIFENLGYTNVSTYINSGNVIFEGAGKPPAIALKIEKALKKSLGFPVRTVVRDMANIKKVAKAIPSGWTNDTEHRTDVLFLWEKFDSKKTISLIAATPGVDTLKYVSGAIVWHFERKNYKKSSMHKFIGTEVYKHMTARNSNTARKLASIAQ